MRHARRSAGLLAGSVLLLLTVLSAPAAAHGAAATASNYRSQISRQPDVDGVLATVATLDLTQVVDALAALPLPVETKAVAATQATLFVAIGAFGALRAWQSRDGGFTALGVGAASLLLGAGLLHLPALTSSQVVSVFAPVLARGVAALSIAQALPLGVVAVVGSRRLAARSSRAAEPRRVAPHRR